MRVIQLTGGSRLEEAAIWDNDGGAMATCSHHAASGERWGVSFLQEQRSRWAVCGCGGGGHPIGPPVV